MLVEKSVGELLNAFSSSDPTPGGGSASALASAVGGSLLMMVAGLPKTRTNAPEERVALREALNALEELRRRLTEAIDADTAAYDRVVAAYRLSKATPAEQTIRQTAIQTALRGATDVPLNVMQWSTDAMRHGAAVARYGLRSASSDVGVAVALLKAGAAGAALNVEINLSTVKDEQYRASVRRMLDQCSATIADASADIDRTLRDN